MLFGKKEASAPQPAPAEAVPAAPITFVETRATSAPEAKKKRVINKSGMDLIKVSEGCKLKSYQDVIGVWTVGYGSTGIHVKPNMTITEEDAEKLLLEDLERFERGVERLAEVDLTDNEFAALVSFSFNVGLGNLEKSTLLVLVNKGKKTEAAEQFIRWNKAGGKEFTGLTKRRLAEKALFLS